MANETSATPPAPERTRYLPHDLVLQILLRLPIKSLLRFTAVSKTWHSTITNDRCFQREQHRLQEPCVLIAPRIRSCIVGRGANVPTTIPALYKWERKSQPDAAILVKAMESFPEEDARRHKLAHCDGLVLVPTVDGTVQVLNLATHRVLTLPRTESPRGDRCRLKKFRGAFGLGHDPLSHTYKVSRFFYRCEEMHMTSSYRCTPGMEIFTVGRDQHWRETAVAPPCSIIQGRTATFFNGSLIWTIGLNPTDVAVMQGFLRFRLEDESFRIMPVPPGCPEFSYTASNLAHQIRPKDGRRAARPAQETWIWAYDSTNPPRWVLRHVIHTSSRIHLITSSDNDGVVFQDGSCILECSNSRRIEGFMSLASMDNLTYHYPDTNTFVEYPREAVYGYDVLPYVPSLVPI